MKVGNEFYCEKAWIVVTFYFSVKQKNSCIRLPPAGDTSKWSLLLSSIILCYSCRKHFVINLTKLFCFNENKTFENFLRYVGFVCRSFADQKILWGGSKERKYTYLTQHRRKGEHNPEEVY